jgi:hypothetical protein
MFTNAHLQTLWGPQWRRLPTVARRLEKIMLSDGDHCWLHWAQPETSAPSTLVVILHGLSGSSDSQYVVGLQHQLQQKQIPSVAVNFRGAAGRHNDRARAYHSGETQDLVDIFSALRQRLPQTRFLAVGYSLGGSRLLNFLAERDASMITAAVSVCVPLDLAVCQQRLNQGFSKVYRNHLISELLAAYRHKLPHLQQVAPEEAEKIRALDLDGIETFRDYDNRVICPLFGFRDAEDYYAQSSAKPKLKRISTPTLMIQASDDPFMTEAVLPSANELSDSIELEVRRGGHVGFVEGLPLKPRYWLESRIPAFLERWC